jgi:hypothetical protein
MPLASLSGGADGTNGSPPLGADFAPLPPPRPSSAAYAEAYAETRGENEYSRDGAPGSGPSSRNVIDAAAATELPGSDRDYGNGDSQAPALRGMPYYGAEMRPAPPSVHVSRHGSVDIRPALAWGEDGSGALAGARAGGYGYGGGDYGGTAGIAGDAAAASEGEEDEELDFTFAE